METNRFVQFLTKWKAKLAPFEVDAAEWFFIRLGLAIVVWMIFPMTLFPAQPTPNGLARLGADFTWLNDPTAMSVCKWTLGSALALYVLNRWLWLALPVMTFLMIASGTLTNSQAEEVSHHSQPVALILLVQTVWLYVGIIRRMRGKPATDNDPDRSVRVSATKRWATLAVYFSIQTFCAAYMVSVVSKMVLSDGKWVKESANFPIQLVKNDLADYYNTVNGEGQTDPTPEGLERFRVITQKFFVDYPNIGRAMLASGMLLEAFCFLALLSRRIASIYGIALIAFHWVISLAMGLTFTYNIILLLIFFVGIPYLLSRPVARILPSSRQEPAA
ncbi:hypothetical protein [Sulfuriroseicoccus oceanibius]|uniref:HTTM domain-containing protein n=1 Tax=Sulfuriroseicoccus oceanibius TaxID=2707525 RepID=A0A6B3L767_9BACT|nr:hypothetical protein [Sulfuriroseicoccus oceanibius]QQL45773.1 hypothetical protein G3M56_004090 [Sulfuriroseicoccus oceanibius]